jgi:hypothetical protein
MKVNNIAGFGASIEFSTSELITINNALNEVCHGIDLGGEFETRMGCTKEGAEHLLDEVDELINSIKHSN